MQAALLESSRATRQSLVAKNHQTSLKITHRTMGKMLKELPLRTKVATVIIRVLTVTVSSFEFPYSCANITHILPKLDQGVKYLSDLIHAMAFTHVCTSKVGRFSIY